MVVQRPESINYDDTLNSTTAPAKVAQKSMNVLAKRRSSCKSTNIPQAE
jgi:hypothetical protein